jgi:hypothetical protein
MLIDTKRASSAMFSHDTSYGNEYLARRRKKHLVGKEGQMDVMVAKIWVSVGPAIDDEAWTSCWEPVLHRQLLTKLRPLSITFLWPLRCCKSRVGGIVCLSDPTVGIRYFLPGAGGMGPRMS